MPTQTYANKFGNVDLYVKCVAVGDGAAGKTSLLFRYTNDSFDEDYSPTIFDTYAALVSVDSKICSISLWDTAGQDDFDRLRPLSYPGTDVFVLVFSVISHASFENVASKWAPELQHYVPSAPVLLVATKTDLRHDKEAMQRLQARNLEPISYSQGARLAKEIGAAQYLECSSKTGEGVKEVFDTAIKQVLNERCYKPKKGSSAKSKTCTIL